MKVPLSFKDKERPIYDYLMNKGRLSPSIFIKQLLEQEMEKEVLQPQAENKGSSKKEMLDF